MIFVNWSLDSVLVCIVVIAGVVGVIWVVRRKRFLIQIPAILVSVPFGLIGSLFLSLAALGQLLGWDTHSAPIYSPNGKAAAWIETSDEGATGGETSVVLYASHGFRTHEIFSGGWKLVDAVQWIDDSNLVLHYFHYEGQDEAKHCESTREVHVQCVMKPMSR